MMPNPPPTCLSKKLIGKGFQISKILKSMNSSKIRKMFKAGRAIINIKKKAEISSQTIALGSLRLSARAV